MQLSKFRAILNFRNFKVALNLMYRFFKPLLKLSCILSEHITQFFSYELHYLACILTVICS